MQGIGLVIYDGDCGFCTKTVIRLTKCLGKKAPNFSTFQSIDLSEFNLTLDQVQMEMKYVDRNGRIWGGAHAFRNVFKDANGVWLLVAGLMSMPLIKQAASLLYRKIAVNRQKMPGASEACVLPKSNSQQS